MAHEATVTVRVTREEGVLLADCDELGISTFARTEAELRAAVADMLQAHFVAARKTGLFAREAGKVGLAADAEVFTLAIRFAGPDDQVVVDLHHAA